MHPDIIAMEGPLGAGKTTLAKSNCEGAGDQRRGGVPYFPYSVLNTQYSVLSWIILTRGELTVLTRLKGWGWPK